jgi:hypothetical protein
MGKMSEAHSGMLLNVPKDHHLRVRDRFLSVKLRLEHPLGSRIPAIFFVCVDSEASWRPWWGTDASYISNNAHPGDDQSDNDQ